MLESAQLDAKQVADRLDSDIRNNNSAWSSFLTELVDVVADYQESKKGLEPDKAVEEAQNVIAVISHYFGGRNIYLPKGDRLWRAMRNIAIFKAFNGSNHTELSIKYKLSVTMIYNIINSESKRRKQAN